METMAVNPDFLIEALGKLPSIKINGVEYVVLKHFSTVVKQWSRVKQVAFSSYFRRIKSHINYEPRILLGPERQHLFHAAFCDVGNYEQIVPITRLSQILSWLVVPINANEVIYFNGSYMESHIILKQECFQGHNLVVCARDDDAKHVPSFFAPATDLANRFLHAAHYLKNICSGVFAPESNDHDRLRHRLPLEIEAHMLNCKRLGVSVFCPEDRSSQLITCHSVLVEWEGFKQFLETMNSNEINEEISEHVHSSTKMVKNEINLYSFAKSRTEENQIIMLTTNDENNYNQVGSASNIDLSNQANVDHCFSDHAIEVTRKISQETVVKSNDEGMVEHCDKMKFKHTIRDKKGKFTNVPRKEEPKVSEGDQVSNTTQSTEVKETTTANRPLSNTMKKKRKGKKSNKIKEKTLEDVLLEEIDAIFMKDLEYGPFSEATKPNSLIRNRTATGYAREAFSHKYSLDGLKQNERLHGEGDGLYDDFQLPYSRNLLLEKGLRLGCKKFSDAPSLNYSQQFWLRILQSEEAYQIYRVETKKIKPKKKYWLHGKNKESFIIDNNPELEKLSQSTVVSHSDTGNETCVVGKVAGRSPQPNVETENSVSKSHDCPKLIFRTFPCHDPDTRESRSGHVSFTAPMRCVRAYVERGGHQYILLKVLGEVFSARCTKRCKLYHTAIKSTIPESMLMCDYDDIDILARIPLSVKTVSHSGDLLVQLEALAQNWSKIQDIMGELHKSRKYKISNQCNY